MISNRFLALLKKILIGQISDLLNGRHAPCAFADLKKSKKILSPRLSSNFLLRVGKKECN